MKLDATIIGVDLGGTKVQAARIRGGKIQESQKQLISSAGTAEQVVQEVKTVISAVMTDAVGGIGIGVPSVVDVEKGIVYDVQNIPSWKEVHLKSILEKAFGVPVFMNNDANCFALGEYRFGKGQGTQNFVGLIIGTGMAAGIVVNEQLYNGRHGGAGEFGMIPYLDQYVEYYASGQFFENIHQVSGLTVAKEAAKGEATALAYFAEYGRHLANGIKSILYTLDPDKIVLGGSVSQSYAYFKEALWEELSTFAYQPIIDDLQIEVSEDLMIPVLGAASLCYPPLA
ncbi:MAG: ROK family protein [Saprospiraceae bacterium]|nr:ROK family protein [Saprospiraceae bacterium]